MRTIRTTTGADITLDGDLLAIMETLYKEVTARKALERSFEDMVREIQHLIGQMTDEELRSYLAESLFLNTVKYENDKLEAYFRKTREELSDCQATEDRRTMATKARRSAADLAIFVNFVLVARTRPRN